MKVLKIYPGNINMRSIAETVDALRQGCLVAFPTDTYYAIGCDALNSQSIEKLCRLKNIDPRKESLSIVCADISQASVYARIDNKTFRILKDHFPGPFTFILQPSTSLPKVFKGRKEVGIRIPDCEISRLIAAELGNPVLSTTAVFVENNHPATDPDNVIVSYENSLSVVIEAGETPGVGTTVVDLTEPSQPQIIREGAGDF